MIRHQPPSDWVAYLVVILVTAATIFGKILITKDTKKDDQSKDN